MPIIVPGDDKTEARRLQRLTDQGQLRRIYRSIYTDDLVQPLESIVRRELFALCALIAPGSIISHRSALEGRRPTAGGNVFLTGANRRDFDLPGVTLRLAQGTGPLDSDIRIPTFGGDAFISSQARALLENLTVSRGDPSERRTLGAEGVEVGHLSRDLEIEIRSQHSAELRGLCYAGSGMESTGYRITSCEKSGRVQNREQPGRQHCVRNPRTCRGNS